ncbi:hypothetical protein [uncultured Chloroflexus sp.]|uniref:hypothetical protein n=1 Tax=uncultured Chloroflexus sp. TaxID=214040 RepID=UPI002612C57B|nr:hypothetical protein [uncultured Chloroflexus sp.]
MRWRHPPYRQLRWIGASYALFLPFIIWWDPSEPKWFVALNLFLAAAIVVDWDSPTLPRQRPFLQAHAFSFGLGNVQAAIWPSATVPNPHIKPATCVAQYLGAGDVFLETDWSFGGYLSYF